MTDKGNPVPKESIPKESKEKRPVGASESFNIKVISSIIENLKNSAKTVVKGATERQVIFGEAYNWKYIELKKCECYNRFHEKDSYSIYGGQDTRPLN